MDSGSLEIIELLKLFQRHQLSMYWNVGLHNRPNPRLWEIVKQKAPMFCHGNFGGWRFQGDREYTLNEVK